MVASREWLKQSLKLYARLDYEDERLKLHAIDLIQDLNKELGQDNDDDSESDSGFPGGGGEEDLDEEIEALSDDDDDEDHEMKDL